MKRYESRNDAPLKFHFFMNYISMPIGVMVLFFRLLKDFDESVSMDWFSIINRTFNIVSIILLLVAILGFIQWKSYGWNSLMAYLGVTVTYNAFLIFIIGIFAPNYTPEAIGEILSILIYAALVFIYYRKRRMLFSPSKINDIQSLEESQLKSLMQPINQEVKVDAQSEMTITPIQANFCRKCGSALISNSRFCQTCGSDIIKSADAKFSMEAK